MGAQVMNKDDLAKCVAPSLKKLGFRKRASTWWRDRPDTIEVFSIQGSSWDRDDWYLNIGVFLKVLEPGTTTPSESKCHVQDRLPPHLSDPSEIVRAADRWFEEHDSILKLASLERAGRLRGLVWASAREMLQRTGV